uniref:MRG domain-containing protein n=1 Tax=Angiostrongylus cantonensis TaxID=6313 RepID=A0A0K0D4R1_ANGCA
LNTVKQSRNEGERKVTKSTAAERVLVVEILAVDEIMPGPIREIHRTMKIYRSFVSTTLRTMDRHLSSVHLIAVHQCSVRIIHFIFL